MISEDMTRAVTDRWFQALAAKDGAAALACLDDNVHWINSPSVDGQNSGIAGLSAIVPWLGDFPDKEAVIASFKIWAELSQVLSFKLVDILISGDQALAIIHEVAVVKATGLNYDIEFIQRIRVANNRIVFWKSYWDTSKGIVAFRGDMRERIIAAAKANDTDEAELVLPFGCNPNTTEIASGQTVLMLAAARGHTEMVAKLLEYGADPNIIDGKAGAGALHKACQGGHLDCVEALVQGGALINTQVTSTGHTPLIEAIWFKSDAIVEFLLDKDARLNTRTTYGYDLDTHLETAIAVNQGKGGLTALFRIKELVTARRRRDDERTRNPLIVAAQQGDLELAKQAIAAGVGLESRAPIIGSMDDGHTPLIIAARNNHLGIVELLIDKGADVNAVEPVFGAVPLHKSTYFGYESVTAALAKAPGINLDYQGPANGYTPLHDSLWHGFPACANILLDAGARLDLVAYDGKLPIDLARQEVPGDPIAERLATLESRQSC